MHDFIIDRGQGVPGTREEAHHGREPVRDGVRLRRSQREAVPRARQAIDPAGLHPAAAQRPELVRQMLLEERNLGLHGQDDVAQARSGAPVRRDAREDPGAALLIHQAARAVDRVDQQAPAAVLFARSPPPRQHEAVAGQSFGHQTERLLARDIGEALHERVLAYPVDGVDRIAVAFRVGSHGGEQLRRLPGARRDHRVADALVQRPDGLEQARGVRHLNHPLCSARSRPPAAPPPCLPGRRRSGSCRRRSPDPRGT